MHQNWINIIFLILIATLASPLKAQNYELPPHPKPGKCYERCFEYDKKIEWKEVDCEKFLSRKHKKKTKEELLKIEQAKLKLKAYQEKLKKLGYKVDITGTLDNKTIVAHHKYLKKKKREKRRKRRADKRKRKQKLK